MTTTINIRVGQSHRLLAAHARSIMSSCFQAITNLTHQMDRYDVRPTAADVQLYIIEVRDLLNTIDEQREHLETENALKVVDEPELRVVVLEEPPSPPPVETPTSGDEGIRF